MGDVKDGTGGGQNSLPTRGLTTVSRWDEEHHEVPIELVNGRVSDVEPRVRSSRAPSLPSG